MKIDPLAGNSVMDHLNAKLRKDIKEELNDQFASERIERSRQRRRQQIAGEKELKRKQGVFIHTSVLEEIELKKEG